MKPAPFDYHSASSVANAIQVLEQADGMGKLIAGGQSLMPVLALRLTRPSVLVDINRVPGLDYFRVGAEEIHVGALVRHHELLEQTEVPLLAEAAKWIGHPAIRSRGTFGGSLAHADPSAEWPAVAVALQATMHLEGPQGSRQAAADEFFLSGMEADLRESELLTGIVMKRPEAWGFAEFSRRHGDFGLVSAAAALVHGSWRVALGGVSGVPHRAVEAEEILNAGPLSQQRVDEAAMVAAEGLEFDDDIHSSAAFRKAMTKVFTKRALTTALGQGVQE